MNTQMLNDLYSDNETVRAVCNLLTARKLNQRESHLSRLNDLLVGKGSREKEKGYGRLLVAAKALEAAGAGVLIRGRRGKPTRFRWSIPTLSLPKGGGVETAPTSTTPPSLVRRHFSIPLEAGEAFLPERLTRPDAERLQAFLKEYVAAA